MERKSGVLLHISSLPSPFGIGTLGREAREFADFLQAAGQRYWQVLPLGPTGFGDSPYQSFSTFAGNPYLIDFRLLEEEGLLSPEDYRHLSWGDDPAAVDYGLIFQNRFPVLRKAFERGRDQDRAAMEAFRQENPWLDDYALFMALKHHFCMRAWLDWPDADVRLRRPEALAHWRRALSEDIAFYGYLQLLFFRQWEKLRDYIHSRGLYIIGDLPIYVALDSADVWADPELFQLDEDRRPTEVAGVPPDYFTAEGQLWGNPLYDYDRMREDGYAWWLRRVEGAARLFDVIRLDHFRGFESYWAVPYGDTTAKNGYWRKGPGMDLIGVLQRRFPNLRFIAEDLGYQTPQVKALLEDSGLPGMKVLEFSFDTREPGDYLPHNFPRNCVCYIGTHDNETVMEWQNSADPADVELAKEYLGLSREEGFARGMLRGGMSSVADTFIVTMQDLLELGPESRMNTPGRPEGNWRWRLRPGELPETLAAELRTVTARYGRL